MIRNTTWIILFCFCCVQVLAQKATDPSAFIKYSEVKVDFLPELDHTALKKQYSRVAGLKPLRFAEPRDIHINITEDGNWEELKSGDKIWRRTIHSKGAHSINLAFSKFELKGNARLYIYNPDMTDVYGPFTEADNDDHLQLWTPIVEGDKVIIELQSDPEYIDKIQLELSRINHDFLDIRKSFLSGECNLDVICGAQDGWTIVDGYRDIISSVGAYTLNGIDQCSGVLINNTLQDCRAFFLTAEHCDVNDNSAQSVVVYWNYENSFCRQPGSIESGRPGDGSRVNFNSGTIHRASSPQTDFTLLELDDPIDPDLNLYFAGWDLNAELPDSSICIHHPGVEEKRISFEFDKLLYEINGQDTSFIRVSDWDIGTTEGGSSGSPLFNPKKRIIGQLQGGFAACGNDEYDSYGWIRRSWEGGGNPNNSLKDWLDPVGVSPGYLDGRSCSYNLTSSENFVDVCGMEDNELRLELYSSSFFDEIVNYTISDISDGLEAELSFTEGSKSSVNFIDISGFSELEEGNYFVEVKVNDGTNEAELKIEIYNYESIPDVPRPSSPSNNAIDQAINLDLSIERPGRVVNIFELSLDEKFEDIIDSWTTDTRLLTLNNLESEQLYFWRVRSQNVCGISDWSEIYSFTTAGVFCTQLRSSDGPMVIDPGGSNTVVSTISVPYPAVIQDVDVLNINGTHDYVSDLQISLDFNDRNTILMKELCDDAEDFNLGFDDEAMRLHIPCPPTDSNMYIPNNSLSVYDNMIAGGDWELVIDDLANFDGGEFKDWTLQVCISESLAPSLIPDRHYITYCEGHDINFTVFYELGDLVSDFEIKAFDRNDQQIDLQYFEHHGSMNTSSVVIPSDALTETDNNIRLELISLPSQSILALSVIRLVESGAASANQIIWPENNSTIDPESFSYVEWVDSNADAYTLQLSQFPDFGKLLLNEESIENTVADLSRFEYPEGIYYIRLVGHYHCGDIYSETVKITLDEGTAVEDLSLSEFRINPNPSDGKVYLESAHEIIGDFQFQIYSIHGQRMPLEQEELDANRMIFSIENYPQGIYILLINDGQNTYKKSLVKI